MARLKRVKKKLKTGKYVTYLFVFHGTTQLEALGREDKLTKSYIKSRLNYWGLNPTKVGGRERFGTIHKEFLEYYEKQIGVSISKNTFITHTNLLHHLEYFNAMKIKDINYKELTKFTHWLIDQGVSNRGVNIRLGEVKKVFNFALHSELIENVIKFPRLREKQHPINPLTDEQCQQILEATIHNKAMNDYLIILLDTGLRPEELNQLTPDDIKSDRIIVNLDRKNKPGREIPLYPHIKERFDRYIAIHGRPSPYLSSNGPSSMIGKISKRLGFHFTAKILRKTYCTRLIDAGIPQLKYCQITGHSADTANKSYVKHRVKKLKEETDKLPSILKITNKSGN